MNSLALARIIINVNVRIYAYIYMFFNCNMSARYVNQIQTRSLLISVLVEVLSSGFPPSSTCTDIMNACIRSFYLYRAFLSKSFVCTYTQVLIDRMHNIMHMNLCACI